MPQMTPRVLRPYQNEATEAVEKAWAENKPRVSVVLPTGTGKAEPVTNEVPTPDGIRRFGDLQVGDLVYSFDGSPVAVTAVHEQGVRDIYRITFSDGVHTLADGEHLWTISRRGSPYAMTRTTKHIMKGSLLDHNTGQFLFRIPLCGATRQSAVVPGVEERTSQVLHHIDKYDGERYSSGTYIVPVTDESKAIQEVVWSLGGTASIFPSSMRIFIPYREYTTVKQAFDPMADQTRYIVSIEPAGQAECRCITVDHPSSLYLTGRAHIVTHNSTVIANVATRARKENKRVLLLAHRTELLDQMAGAVEAVDPSGEKVGIVAADRNETSPSIVAASFQTLARSPNRLAALGRRDVILADECFPAGTLMADGTPIEDVRVGDTVDSWDEVSRSFTQARVEKITVAIPSSLVRVTFDDETSTVCTPGHPFLTPNLTWVAARSLEGEMVVRRSSGDIPRTVGVSSVVELDKGRDVTFGGACPDGFVYNLEVEGTHTYLIEHGTVVHNCHHISAPTYLKVLEDFGAMDDESGVVSCGFTATMYRDDGKALGDVWNHVVFERDLIWAIENGFLIPPKGKTVAIQGLNKLASIKNQGGDYKQSDLDDVMGASVESTVDAILRHCPKAAMIVFAVSVEHARKLAEMLTSCGIPSRDVTGSHNRDYREEAYSDFRAGRLNCLVTVQVLTEGADFPRCDTVVLARPTRSKVLLTQIIGRSVRQYTDPVTGLAKSEATVLDLTGVVRDVKLASLTDLYPEAEHQVFDESGTERTDDEMFMDTHLNRPSKKERMGRLELEDIDLIGTRPRSKVVWLRTGPLNEALDEVAFMPLKHPGEYVFIYPPVNRIGNDPVGLGYMNRRGDVGFLRDPNGNLIRGTISQAMDGAEKMAGPQNFIRNDAPWRRPGVAASHKQIEFGRNLKIPDVENLSRGQLNDKISSYLATRVFRDVVRKYPSLPSS